MDTLSIVNELQELTAESRKGVPVLFEAEEKLAKAELELDRVEAQAFLGAQGSVADRTAAAKLAAAEVRFERDIAKAEVNRVRTKLRVIEQEIMAQATISKLVQAEMKL